MILNPWRALREQREEHIAVYSDLIRQVEKLNDELDDAVITSVVLENALRNIVAQEKPTSNSTVKRMAGIAREALIK